MASKSAPKGRAKGTGNINKIGNRFYWRVKVAGKVKNTLLRNQDDTPCTKRTDAEAAVKLLVPILQANQKEQIALHIAEAKKLRKRSGLLLSSAWETYMEQHGRPDSGEATLNKYRRILLLFLEWLKKRHPDKLRIAEIDHDIALEYFSALWASGVSASCHNSYLQALKLVFRHLAIPAALEENPFDGIAKKTVEVISRHEFTEEQVKQIFDGFHAGFFYETEIEKLATGRTRERVTVRRQYHPMNSAEMFVLLNLCCWTGCDGQCGCLMTWRNIDLKQNKLSYVRYKTKRKKKGIPVSLPIHPDLRSALLQARKWQKQNEPGEDYILPAVAKRYQSNPSGIQKDVMKIISCATGLKTNRQHRDGSQETGSQRLQFTQLPPQLCFILRECRRSNGRSGGNRRRYSNDGQTLQPHFRTGQKRSCCCPAEISRNIPKGTGQY